MRAIPLLPPLLAAEMGCSGTVLAYGLRRGAPFARVIHSDRGRFTRSTHGYRSGVRQLPTRYRQAYHDRSRRADTSNPRLSFVYTKPMGGSDDQEEGPEWYK